MFATVGLFYEFEKWKDPTPNPPELHVYSRSIKTHLSLSFRQKNRRQVGSDNHCHPSGETRQLL